MMACGRKCLQTLYLGIHLSLHFLHQCQSAVLSSPKMVGQNVNKPENGRAKVRYWFYRYEKQTFSRSSRH